VSLGLLVPLLFALPVQGATQERPYEERVFVERVVVNVHVVDNLGRPIPGLTASDFRVAVDGKPVPLESVEWVPTAGPPADGARAVGAPALVPPLVLSETAAGTAPPDGDGRLIVVLFQWEIAGQKQEGFVRMQRQALDFARALGPRDRVAVLLFGSRLWLQQDFTRDRGRIEAGLGEILRTAENRARDPDSDVSLADRLTEEDARSATTIEKALAAVGRALEPIAGKKSLLLFGWGIGKWSPTFRNELAGYVRQTPDYEPARQVLSKAETSVFCLDVSNGAHGLAAGLERVAFDTGGFYVPTWDFPQFAMRKVERALTGHYVLVFRKLPAPPGRHSIEIRLAGRAGNVFHRRSYEDGEAQ
jgi:VWFA-related protein